MPTNLSATKIIGYTVTGEPVDSASSTKLIHYVITGEFVNSASAMKMVSYAVLSEAEVTASKVIAYVVVEEQAPTRRPFAFVAT